MLSDNGREFKSDITNKVFSLFGVGQRYITPYNPQANGLCERMNAIISTAIAKLCGEDKTEWPGKVQESLFYYNSKVNTSTGRSPYEVVYGRKCMTKLAATYRRVPASADEEERIDLSSVEAECEAIISAATEAREAVATKVMTQQRKKDAANKRQYDQRRGKTGAAYQAGHKVLEMDKQLTNKMYGRMQPRWSGPYKITKMAKTTVQLQHIETGKQIARVPISLLKRYNE
eukprot:GEMP01087536.1.p2 GENE.GEMP01087536.1~~GEMP01087536.1.p2  ORF type:complete len:231 (-),score=29.23 GEMP01087536.1:35-727(-)